MVEYSTGFQTFGIREVSLDGIQIAPYQRRVDFDRAKRIAKSFDYERAGFPILNERNSKLYVVDGLHRITAMRINKISSWPCLVLDVDYAREAELFFTQGKDRKQLSTVDVYNAMLTAGVEEIFALNEIITESGYRVAYTTKSGNAIPSAGTLMKLQKTHGLDIIRDALYIIKNAWAYDKQAKRQEMLIGLCEFVRIIKDQLEWDSKTKRNVYEKLALYTPASILANARSNLYSTNGIGRTVCDILIELYNSRKTIGSKNRIEKR